jgi:hypothetical protein
LVVHQHAEFGDAVPDAEGRKAYMAGLSFRTVSVAKVARTLQDGKIGGVVKGAPWRGDFTAQHQVGDHGLLAAESEVLIDHFNACCANGLTGITQRTSMAWPS